MSSTANVESAPGTAEVKCTCHLTAADALVKKYTYWSAGAGLLPVGGVDLLAIGGVQLKLVSELS